MEIKAADVAKLRKMTGAGMMDCKKALQEAEGDFDRAQEIIREKGKLIASKRAEREASEGVVVVVNNGTKAYMLALACETDFVAKNESFSATANEILNIAVTNDAADIDTLKAINVNGQTIAEMVTDKSGQTGEKIEIAFYTRIEANFISSYVHFNKKLGTLIGFNETVNEEVAKNVAVQAATMAPVAISKDDCDATVLEKERQIGREQARLDGKPEAMLDKIADGKVNKFLSENTLLNQASIDDSKISVEKYIAKSNPTATVTAYKRFALND